jgi:16S rRNA pseudouridine516 synthase
MADLVAPELAAQPALWTFVVDGREWPYRERAVVMLNKPSGYECSLKPRHHPSVMSLLPTPLRLRGLQPIGRLDEDTTGLLLLTDDGELNHRLTSPKWHADKVYHVSCKHELADDVTARLLAGVVLDDDPQAVRALAVEPLRGESGPAMRLTIGEGRYHQVKRMVAAVGNRVEALHRLQMGTLELDPSLEPGQWRWLTPQEEAALRESVRLS